MKDVTRTLLVSFVVLLALAAGPYSVWAQDAAVEDAGIGSAAALTQVFATPTNNLVFTETYYTLLFKAAVSGPIKTIEMAFPAGFTVTNARLMEKAGIGNGTLSISGTTVLWTVTATPPPSVPAGRAIRILVAGLVNNGVTAPQVVNITTKNEFGVVIDGPTASASVLLTAVDSSRVADESLTSSDLGPNSVGSSEITDGTVTGADIADGTITGTDILDNSVGSVDVGFNYAGSSSKGGPAVGLVCIVTPCVSDTEVEDNISVNNGRLFALAGAGAVGIGTTTPTEKLHVAGNFIKVDGAANEQAYIGGDGFGGDVQVGSLNPNVAGVAMFNPVRPINGWMTVLARAFTTVSDLKYKKDIETVQHALDKVAQLRGVAYTLKGSEEKQIGFIAQEVKEVLPEVVSQDENGVHSIAYASVIPVLVEAVKEQQQIIEDLKKKISEIDVLRAQLGEIDDLRVQLSELRHLLGTTVAQR